MRNKIPTHIWFPAYIDKILLGSSNWELTNDEFGIFWKLLALSKKDDGWIRANPDMAYPPQAFLAYNIKEDELEKTIRNCCKYGKFAIYDENNNEIVPVGAKPPLIYPEGTIYLNRILRVTKNEEYDLSGRHKRRITNEITGDNQRERGSVPLKN